METGYRSGAFYAAAGETGTALETPLAAESGTPIMIENHPAAGAHGSRPSRSRRTQRNAGLWLTCSGRCSPRSGLLLAGIGFPIPEEIPTVVAGIWVASSPDLGELSVFRWLILPVCYLGVITSDVMLYSIGRLWGPRLLQHRWLARFFPADKRDQIECNFHHYGIKILLCIRWVPAIRSPMFVTAGIMRVPLLRFVLADGIAAIFGHSLLFFLAYWFGDAFMRVVEKAESVLDWLKPVIIMALIAGVAAYFLVHFSRRPVSTGDPNEVPLIGSRVASTMESMDRALKELQRQQQVRREALPAAEDKPGSPEAPP